MKDLRRAARWTGGLILLGAALYRFGGCATREVRSSLIKSELAKLDGQHEWAGDYYHGDGRGVNVRLALAPSGGFVFSWHGCLGEYDRNHGSVVQDAKGIHLRCALPNKREGFRGIATDFIPVRWGERHYLVATNEMVRFCNAVNALEEPRGRIHGRFLMRRGDEDKPANGLPTVPTEYLSYFLKMPVEAVVTKVGEVRLRPSIVDFKFRDTTAAIDAGKSKGVLLGMEFSVTEPDRLVVTAQVTKVEDQSSEVVFTQIDDEKERPEVGWKLSTKPRWR